MLHFTKYQGTGNDFILIDDREEQTGNIDVAFLCHPKFGIGADGLMLLRRHKDYDFEMVYYNSDGRISTMCGNGGRCIVDFAARLGVFQGERVRFLAADGPHEAIWKPGYVELQMKAVNMIRHIGDDCVLDTGSPHYVRFCEDVQSIQIIGEARAIRYNDEFRDAGINVNFVQISGEDLLKVRTYERGVENETLSCGTGVTASALAYAGQHYSENAQGAISIETPGGDLSVKFRRTDGVFDEIWLCGPATRVFDGRMEA